MEQLPHWDLTSIYPAVSDSAFDQDVNSLAYQVQIIRDVLADEAARTADFPAWLVLLLNRYQVALDTAETLYAYASALVTVDTHDEAALRALNRVEEASLAIKAVHVEFLYALARHRSEVEAAKASDDRLVPFAYILSELFEEQ